MRATTTIIAFIVGFLGAGSSSGMPGPRCVWIRASALGCSVLYRRPWMGSSGELQGALPLGAGGRGEAGVLAVASGPCSHLIVVPASRGRDPLTRGLLPPALIVLLPVHPPPNPAAHRNHGPSEEKCRVPSCAAQSPGSFLRAPFLVLGKAVFKKLPGRF